MTHFSDTQRNAIVLRLSSLHRIMPFKYVTPYSCLPRARKSVTISTPRTARKTDYSGCNMNYRTADSPTVSRCPSQHTFIHHLLVRFVVKRDSRQLTQQLRGTKGAKKSRGPVLHQFRLRLRCLSWTSPRAASTTPCVSRG